MTLAPTTIVGTVSNVTDNSFTVKLMPFHTIGIDLTLQYRAGPRRRQIRRLLAAVTHQPIMTVAGMRALVPPLSACDWDLDGFDEHPIRCLFLRAHVEESRIILSHWLKKPAASPADAAVKAVEVEMLAVAEQLFGNTVHAIRFG